MYRIRKFYTYYVHAYSHATARCYYYMKCYVLHSISQLFT